MTKRKVDLKFFKLIFNYLVEILKIFFSYHLKDTHMFIMYTYFIKQKYLSAISTIISTHYQFFYQIHIVCCSVSTVETICYLFSFHAAAPTQIHCKLIPNATLGYRLVQHTLSNLPPLV